MRRLWMYVVLCTASFWGVSLPGWGQAQVLSSEAQQALNLGSQSAAQALATYDEQLLDKPLWREAIAYGEQAKQLAPNAKEPYGFLGRVYGTVKWYSKSWESWKRYLDLGGTRNAQTDRYIVEASSWLGNNSFEAKNYEEAIAYYSALHEIDPGSEEANQHLALSYIELKRPQEAQPYLERLAETNPNNPEYSNLYADTTRKITYGAEAVAAFDEGMSLYNGGRKDEALFAFRRATQANENFKDAFVFAGRTSLELGLATEATGYWKRTLELEPTNAEAQQQLALAEGQSRYGAGAFSSFQQGLALYQQARLDEARQSFLSAVSQNSRYEEAWAYLGRIAGEQQDYQGAVTYYTSALSLSPANPAYTAAITEAQQTLDTQAAALAQAEAEQQAEAARLEAERQAEAARREEAEQQAEAARLEAERLAQAQAEAQAAAEAADTEQAAQTAAEEAARQAAEAQAAAEAAQAEAERLAQEQAAREQAEAQAAAEAERLAQEQAAAEETARLEAERVAQEQAQLAAAAEPVVAGGGEPQVAGGPVVLLDITYSHKKSEDDGSGAFSFFKTPQSLRGDISNFANGTVYQRLEVTSKPSDKPVNYQLCLVNGEDVSVGPACSALGGLAFSSTGVYESEQSVTGFSNYGGMNWTRGLSEAMLVLKNEDGKALDDRYYAPAPSFDLNDYYPMDVRYTAIFVPEGSSFPGWP
jgi:tetratricopeptide (TPR) repeat protein